MTRASDGLRVLSPPPRVTRTVSSGVRKGGILLWDIWQRSVGEKHATTVGIFRTFYWAPRLRSSANSLVFYFEINATANPMNARGYGRRGTPRFHHQAWAIRTRQTLCLAHGQKNALKGYLNLARRSLPLPPTGSYHKNLSQHERLRRANERNPATSSQCLFNKKEILQ